MIETPPVGRKGFHRKMNTVFSGESEVIMRLKDLEQYDEIVIQCHDNPDADALASGFGVYSYLNDCGKQVSLVYSGREIIRKANLLLMIQEFQIPIIHISSRPRAQLLVTVDCQYGEGNVQRLEADTIAIVDHHIDMGFPADYKEIRSCYGSCSTLVWQLLRREHYPVNENPKLASALFYGLYMDTDSLAEINHPMDKDLRDCVTVQEEVLYRLKNSNLSMDEMEIVADALRTYEYHPQYRFAVVKTKACDPNILGMVSDLMRQVDVIDTCVVYCRLAYGIKLSVRCCTPEIMANELAIFLTAGLGSGGGHTQKAGGFIPESNLRELPGDISQYLSFKLIQYKDDIDMIQPETFDFTGMSRYQKRYVEYGYVSAGELLSPGMEVMIRTLKGDFDLEAAENLYFLIDSDGEVTCLTWEELIKKYSLTDAMYELTAEYLPNIYIKQSGKAIELLSCAKSCTAKEKTTICARRLTRTVKVQTLQGRNSYMLGQPGDYLAVSPENPNELAVLSETVFLKTYELIDAQEEPKRSRSDVQI